MTYTDYTQGYDKYLKSVGVAGGVNDVKGYDTGSQSELFNMYRDSSVNPSNLVTLTAEQASAIPGAVAGQQYTTQQLNALGNAQANTSTDGGHWYDTDVKGAGGSNFSNTMGGLASLYGIYGSMQAQKMAKEQLGLQKQQFAAAQAADKRHTDNMSAIGSGLAAASAKLNPTTRI